MILELSNSLKSPPQTLLSLSTPPQSPHPSSAPCPPAKPPSLQTSHELPRPTLKPLTITSSQPRPFKCSTIVLSLSPPLKTPLKAPEIVSHQAPPLKPQPQCNYWVFHVDADFAIPQKPLNQIVAGFLCYGECEFQRYTNILFSTFAHKVFVKIPLTPTYVNTTLLQELKTTLTLLHIDSLFESFHCSVT